MIKTLLHVVRVSAPCAALMLPACADDSGDDFPTDDNHDSNTQGDDDATETGDTGDDANADGATDTGDDATDTGDGDTDDGDTGDDSTDTDDGDDSDEDSVGIRIVNASADRAAIDVYVDGEMTAVAAGLAYGQPTGYLEGPAGTRFVEIRTAGSAATTPPLATLAFDVAADERVTAVLAGDAEATSTAPQIIAVHESFADAGAEQSVVRLVHAGVDIDVVAADVGVDGTAEIEGLKPFASSDESGVTVDAGEVRVGLTAGNPVTSFTTDPIAAGRQVLLVATGRIATHPRSAGALELIVLDDRGTAEIVAQDPLIHVFHAGVDTGPLSVCVAGVLAASGISAGTLVPAQPAPGVRDVSVADGDCSQAPIASAELTFDRGQRYLVTVSGEATVETGDPGAVSLFAFQDAFTLETAGRGWLRVVHAASAPTVDIGALTDADVTPAPQYVLFQDLSWGTETEELDVGPDDYRVGALQPNAEIPATALISFTVPAVADSRNFIVAAGDLTPEDGDEGMTLNVVETATVPWSSTRVDPN